MIVQQKADIASASTVSLSGIGLWMHIANGWVAEYMPLITAFGILSGTVITGWYYYQSIQQKKRDRALRHKELEDARIQREHERHMSNGHEDK